MTMTIMYPKADSRFAASQRETLLLCNDVPHWLGTSIESALYSVWHIQLRWSFAMEPGCGEVPLLIVFTISFFCSYFIIFGVKQS